MDRIIAPGSVPLSGADVAPSSGTPQYATSGNPALGLPATSFPAYAWNMIQEELRGVVTGAGLTPDGTNWGQLLAAINALIGKGRAQPKIARSTHGVAIGANYNGTVSVSITAPCAGYIVAQAGLNISLGTAAAAIVGTLYFDGVGMCNDSTLNGQTQQSIQAVAAGSTVTVAWTITTTTSPTTNATYFVSAQFVPYP